jgi:hypothetical protein
MTQLEYFSSAIMEAHSHKVSLSRIEAHTVAGFGLI